MSRKPLNTTGSTANAGATNNGYLYKTSLVKITSDGTINEQSKSLGRFLLNPESLEESIDVNWVANAIPGQSNPIYQWMNGGPRVITFDALVTRDTSEFLKDKNQNSALATGIDSAVNAVGNIASSFLGINIPSVTDLFGAVNNAVGENLSIENYLNYYRSLCYPTYVAGKLDASPPLLVLYNGRTFSSANSIPADKIGPNSDVWVLTNLKIRITKQLPNLLPMEAMVSFKLAQYPFTSIGSNHFANGAGNDDSILGSGSIGSVLAGLF